MASSNKPSTTRKTAAPSKKTAAVNKVASVRGPKAPKPTRNSKAPAAPPVGLYQRAGAEGGSVEPGFDAWQVEAPEHRAQHALWGVLPGGFSAASGLSAEDLRKWISAHPGFDCYYGSLSPAHEALFHNTWVQAEVAHPGFSVLAAEVLKAAGLPQTPVQALSHSSLFTNGSQVGSTAQSGAFVVATPAFWAGFEGFMQRVISAAQQGLPKNAKEALFGAGAGSATIRGLLIERLLSVFLLMKDSVWKAAKIPVPQLEQALNPHLRLLREMKDQAIAQRSRWLAECWLNYRNLYLLQTQGAPWVKKFLGAITPKALHVAQSVAQVHYVYAAYAGPKAVAKP